MCNADYEKAKSTQSPESGPVVSEGLRGPDVSGQSGSSELLTIGSDVQD